jgi:lysophospholipase L1-like esterase
MMRKLFSVSVLGWSFLAIGLIGNPWVVGRYFTQDGNLDLHTRTALLILAAIFMFWGMVILYQRRVWKARQISYLLVTTVITLAIVETGLQVLCIIKNKAVVDVRMLLSVYKNEPWGDQYWKEYKSTSFHYEPFILWNADEYHGKWINIDQNGLRKTWAPGGAKAPAPEEIYVIGGSAIWGIGARDDYTIPSNLSKLLNAEKQQYRVSNYGMPGFTFLQEIIKLSLLLQKGQRPHYVIFYDGANDVYAAYQSGRVVDFLDYRETKDKVETSPIILGSKYLIAKCRIVQAVEKTLAFVHLQANFQEGGASFTDKQLEVLANDIAENYKKSASLLHNLSKVYNFTYVLFWQPVIFTEVNAVEEEVRLDPHCQDKQLAKLFKLVKGSLVSSSIPHWHDLSAVLHQGPKPAYIDFCHLTEKGYERVTAKMGAIVKPELLSIKSVPR